MQIDGSALAQRLGASSASSGGGGGGDNSYDAQIKRLQEKRAEYVEKLSSVHEEPGGAEKAKMYQMNITSIDARIAQLEKAKADDAQRAAEERQAKTEPSREREAEANGAAGEASRTRRAGEAGKPSSAQPAKAEEADDRTGGDPFDLNEGEELFWIDSEAGSWPAKKRKPEYPSALVDVSV